MPSYNIDLIDLARRLKHEKLFVSNERKEIEGLNRKVQLLSTGLLHQTWLTGQHRLALEKFSRGPGSSPFVCPFVSIPSTNGGDVAENLELTEAHKHICPKYLQSYIDLIALLRNHPDIVGLCLSTYEREKSNCNSSTSITFGDVLQAVVNIYGGIGGPLPADGTLHLKLLSVLAGLQLVGSESPRRVLRVGSCAFSSLYRIISETIPSSRLFLVGALHQPITQLLSSQELICLGTNIPAMSPLSSIDHSIVENPNSTVNRDIASLDKTEKMAQLTKLFIESILDNIHAFPTGLAWLIKSVHTQLSGSLPEKEVSAICTDLIWALFICPAVTNPEPFGVTDAPVGSQARHTLSQVATILQALALYRWEGSDPRLTEYISYFDPESLSSILDHVLSLEGLPTEQSIASSLSRRTVLIPENLLQPLFLFLKESLVLLEQNGKLTDIEIWPTLVKLTTTVNENITQVNSSSAQSTMNSASSNATVGNNTNLSSSFNSLTTSSSPSHTPNFLTNGRRNLLNRFSSSSSPRPESKVIPPPDVNGNISVIVFPVTQQAWEWVGMSCEAEVIAAGKKSVSVGPADVVDPLVGIEDAEDEEREDRGSIGEKRTRFSLSHDDGSIGTSDNLEAVSEAASTHSVSSSIELEDQNDNLSDMLSANVSGRGTPNVSGRNTPQEEADESGMGDEVDGREVDNEDVVMRDDVNDANDGEIREPEEGNVNPPNLNNLNLHGHQMPDPAKQARSEIQDKFCKFEIRKAMFGGDETVSLVSDTWSTDVLASDSEMGGENSNQLHQLLNVEMMRAGQRLPSIPNNPVIDRVVDISNVGIADSNPNNETMSEAWSTDVAANDIERLHDFDNDDTLSVARSDDTGRSEIESVSYDTPRSSVSGRGGNYMQRRDEPMRDLLLFDDLQPGNNTCSDPISVPLRPSNDLQIVQDQPMNEMNQNVPTPQQILMPEIVSASIPGSLGLNLLNSLSSSANGIGSNLLPGTSRSGAIPKTISFDKTAERGDRENWDEESGRTRRFFRNFRLPFRGRNRKSRGHDERFEWENRNLDTSGALSVPKLRKSFSEDLNGPTPSTSSGLNEENEILAKYRRKPSLTDSTDGGPIMPRNDLNGILGNIPKHGLPPPNHGNPSVIVRKESLKITRAELVHDARKKLRNVLSNCDLQLSQNSDGIPIDNLLINLLRVEVASAISRSDQVLAAQLQEAIRTIKQLGVDGCRKVLRLLRDDYRRRSEFISYLMRAKQGLLSTIQFLERSTVRAKHEGDTYSHYLITECVRLWLEETNQCSFVEEFITEFRSATAVDEKIELLEGFLYSLVDLFIGNKELTEWQLAKTEYAVEQNIVSKIYLLALYPNDDADVHRDVVFKEHITRLEQVITPSHRDLRIPKSQLGECPWPPAQRELKMLSAYKTPSDKLRCIVRTCSLIVNLLSSSAEKVVAADDFVPVLVFVIIKTNPPALLSTIQYVNSFYGQRISGEDQYWWVQFCSAVEFIKTMEYNLD